MLRAITAAIATVFLASAVSAAPIQWTTGTGANFHWYDFIILSSPITPEDAETMAESMMHLGESGYLATITSLEEQVFLNSVWPGMGSVVGQFGGDSFFMIGASDRDVEGTFEWIGGPEEGDALVYTNWSLGEPNNTGGVEDYVVAWWLDAGTGAWNDIPEGSGSDVLAYVVEFDGVIPLPAGLPLLASALGLLAMVRRRLD